MALGAVFSAVQSLLLGTGAVTGLIASKPASWGGGKAVYDEGSAPPDAPKPYLTIGAGTMVPFHTFATPGWNCTVQIKAVGTGSEASGLAIVEAIVATCSQGRALTVSGYTSAWCDDVTVVPTIQTVQAGVVVREWPVILRVFAT